jgi:hypothetical protein
MCLNDAVLRFTKDLTSRLFNMVDMSMLVWILVASLVLRSVHGLRVAFAMLVGAYNFYTRGINIHTLGVCANAIESDYLASAVDGQGGDRGQAATAAAEHYG